MGYGLYIHIPFCHKKCFYCDFYSVRLAKNTDIISDFIDALYVEIERKRKFFPEKHLTSVYVGGGTPSVLSFEQLQRIIDMIVANFTFPKGTEITLEVNPEDISEDFLSFLRDIRFFNRLSVGVQSFNDDFLSFLGRNHDVATLEKSLDLLNNRALCNYNLDLIYGIPGSDLSMLKSDLEKLVSYRPTHISAYHLGIEQGTVLYRRLRQKKFSVLPDTESFEQFVFVHDFLERHGYKHYEISNFSFPYFHSRHNKSYWTGRPYLGLGASAHSFTGEVRLINVANVFEYLRLLKLDMEICETDVLSEKDFYNEYVMTHFRMSEGLDLQVIKNRFAKFYPDFLSVLDSYLDTDLIDVTQSRVALTLRGWFVSDAIISDFFVV